MRATYADRAVMRHHGARLRGQRLGFRFQLSTILMVRDGPGGAEAATWRHLQAGDFLVGTLYHSHSRARLIVPTNMMWSRYRYIWCSVLRLPHQAQARAPQRTWHESRNA